jgi:hypothetical protein
MRRFLLLVTMLASGGAGAITMTMSHPYGEFLERGSVTIRVDVTTAWDCTTTTVVDLAARRITLTGGLSPPGPPLNCFAPWVSVLSPLPAGRYTVTAQVASSSGAVAEATTVPMEIFPVEGRCNAAPELVPTMWGVHGTLAPAELAQKVANDAAYATSLGNPIVQPSGIVSTTFGREYAALTYPPLDNPSALTARLLESGEFVGVSRNGYACLSAPPPDAVVSFVEFYHAGLDHYFYTSDLVEIAAIEAGNVGPWVRTGKAWNAVRHPGCVPSSVDTTVYRFSGIPGKGPSSHFFTRERAECYAVDKSGPWLLEGVPFYAAPADAAGSCPAERIPLYRAWRPFGDSNHRFTTDRAVVAEMAAKGWVDEGVAMCVRPPSS